MKYSFVNLKFSAAKNPISLGLFLSHCLKKHEVKLKKCILWKNAHAQAKKMSVLWDQSL